MLIQPIDYFLVAWFAVAILSTIWVGWDQFRNNPEPAVMKWGARHDHGFRHAGRRHA